MPIAFVNNHTDMKTVDFIAKSLSSTQITELLSKGVPLDTSKLVRVERTYTVNGKEVTTHKWISPNEVEPQHKVVENHHNLPQDHPQYKPMQFAEDELHDWKHGDPLPDFISKEYGKIPPNWSNVQITTNPHSKVWIDAKDTKGRIQRKYHPAFVEQGQQEKWGRCISWTTPDNYSKLQQSIRGIAEEGTQKAKDVSDCLQLMLEMGLRPSSDRDTKSKKKAYGATTLQGNHLVLEGNSLFLRFVGKDGVDHNHEVINPELKDMLLKRKESVGENDQIFSITDVDLRATLKPFGLKSKDLRTICAIRNAKQKLKDIPSTDNPKEYDKTIKQVCDYVCGILGNRREQTYKSYIPQSVWREWSPKGHKAWIDKKGGASNG